MHALACPSLPASLKPEDSCGPLARLFGELDGRDWPAPLLERRLPDLLAQAGALEPEARSAWLAGLHQCWRRHGWAFTPDGQRMLLELAASWCAWPLAQAVGAALRGHGPLAGADALRMLDACRHLGDGDTAIELAVGLQLAHPAEPLYADAHRELQAWLRWRAGMPVVDGSDWNDAELALEPLAHHHLPDFAWQYHDPDIAERCALPHFEDDVHWHRWLDVLHADANQRVFAVLHREWGFIGCVSLILHDGVGFFYYWLGPDFQGHGFGPRAVALLLAMARRDYGMRCCYAKVYDTNAASRRALEKLGFEALGICGAAPDQNQMFYRCGERQPGTTVVEELHLLLARIDSDTRAAAPVVATR